VLHSDWGEHPGPYAIDIRRPARGHVWRLSVATAGSPDATLRLRFLVPPPPGTAVDVIDLMTRLRASLEGKSAKSAPAHHARRTTTTTKKTARGKRHAA